MVVTLFLGPPIQLSNFAAHLLPLILKLLENVTTRRIFPPLLKIYILGIFLVSLYAKCHCPVLAVLGTVC